MKNINFYDFLNQEKDKSFDWGTHDCCLFPANAHLAVNGIDYVKKYRGYSTELGAWKMLIQNFDTIDLREVLEKIAKTNNFKKIHGIHDIQDGDVTAIKFSFSTRRFTGLALSLIVDGRVWVPSNQGLLSRSVLSIQNQIWRPQCQ